MTEPTRNNTIASMLSAKMIKRTDKGMFIALANIHIDQGFNKRRECQRLEDSIDELVEFLIDREAEARGEKKLKDLSQYLPQIEAYPHPESGIIVVEGHRRTRALRKLEAMGYEIPMVPFKPFVGTPLERKARIATSNSQLELEPLDLADLYMDFQDNDGLTPDEIAKLVNKTRQHVEQMLKLGRAGEAVHAQIEAGLIAPGTAVGIIRQHGENAAAEIQRQHEEAKKQGKAKVTSSTIKKAKVPSVPKALATDMAAAASRLAQEVPEDVLALVERYRRGEHALGDQPVSVSIRALNALLATTSHWHDVKAEAEAKVAQDLDQALEKVA